MDTEITVVHKTLHEDLPYNVQTIAFCKLDDVTLKLTVANYMMPFVFCDALGFVA